MRIHRKHPVRPGAISAAVGVAVLLLSGCTGPAEGRGGSPRPPAVSFATETSDRLDAALREAMTLSGASGAIAGVWAPWAGEWLAAPGSTRPGSRRAVDTGMVFRIGTNTTSMTCTVLLRLVDAGEVQLTDPVSRFLQNTAGLDGITVGQLCRNTSGLADFTSILGPQFVSNPTRNWPPREVIASGMGARRVGPPGGAWSRSDTGIVLLGLALEAATHQSWSALYKRYIFDPLGMTETSLPGPDELGIPGRHPNGFTAALQPSGSVDCATLVDVTELSPSIGGVAGGVVSTLADLKIWAGALAEGSLLSRAAADAQWTTLAMGPDVQSWQRQGLGVEQLGPLRGHAGAVPGFTSAFFADPVSGLAIVVVLNNSTAGSGFGAALVRRLASIVSGVPAAAGAGTPFLGLPWSEDQATAEMRAGAPCPGPPPAQPATPPTG